MHRFLLVTLFLVGAARAQETGPPLSPRNANYVIEVALDPAAKILDAREVVTWRNVQDRPTSELGFHLYWNAWRNSQSSWMREDRLRGRSDRGDDVQEGDWGYLDIGSIKLLPGIGHEAADLTSVMRYVSPDDGNPQDRTVMVLDLPREVAPGESVDVEIRFRAKIPRTFARTGFRGHYFFIAHWYPSLGVFEPEGWNCHQFHAGTEFYSDFGVYDVSMTVPANFVLGASGRLVDRKENSDGTVTYRHVQADIHNFAWTTSPDYQVRERRFAESGLPPVDMRLLIQPEHLGQADRHFAATEAALKYYGTWFGPYPYGHVTIVDPAYGSGAGGMEYPTLFTCGTRLFNPFVGGSPEGVTIHEAGHQFWYGIVGNNEFEHAWLDEGFNSFSDARTHDVAYGDAVLVRRYLRLPGRSRGTGAFFPVLFPDLKRDRMVDGNGLDGYRSSAIWDSQATDTYHYFPGTGGGISYSKTALWLSTLERYLGWETLQKIMSTHFERWKFKHPRPENFIADANEIGGQDLSWFFDQVYRSSDSFDYAIESVASKPAEVQGFVEQEDQQGNLIYIKPVKDGEEDEEEGDGTRVYRTEVVARRIGGATFPVDVLMVFEDGSEVRESWDGQYRWKLFVEERPSKLKYAAVDPERKLLLDLSYTNNSKLLEPASALPAYKWASKWMIWLQDLLATFAFFV
jgi:hypothetical protein